MANARTEYQRQWYLKNREKRLEQSRANYLRNREKRLAQTKKYQELHPEVSQKAWRKHQSTHKEARRKSCREWYRRNREQELLRAAGKSKAYYAAHKEEVLSNNKEWRKQHPNNILASSAKRRALKKGASVNLKQMREWINAVKARSFIRCYYCDTPTSTATIHFDHIIPLSKGGPHSVENLCVACPTCNLTKKAKTVDAWVRVGQQILAL